MLLSVALLCQPLAAQNAPGPFRANVKPAQTITAPTAPVMPKIDCGRAPKFEPPPGNVWDFGFQQSRLVKRNAAFDATMPLVVCELTVKGYIAEPVQRVQAPTVQGWIYPVYFLLTVTDTSPKPFPNSTALVLYHYDMCSGQPACLASFLIGQHQWARDNP